MRRVQSPMRLRTNDPRLPPRGVAAVDLLPPPRGVDLGDVVVLAVITAPRGVVCGDIFVVAGEILLSL